MQDLVNIVKTARSSRKALHMDPFVKDLQEATARNSGGMTYFPRAHWL